MKEKTKNPYLWTLFWSCLILLLIFLGKEIYPFGKNTVIYGDMHDQITAFYYHFYDCFHGNSSLLIDFSTSAGINFLGILAYYILSPCSFLLLLFPRNNLYLAVSLVVAFKIILSSMTCLYSIRVLWKKKCPFWLSVLLALSYAFSGYALILYQITSWMDAMYLFPLIVVGIKKVLDLEKPYLYIFALTLSLLFSFYVSFISLIFLFFLSFLYLFIYQEKKSWKKRITALGISTVVALGLSACITLPALIQIFESSRLSFSLSTIMNSKTGPILDKLSFFFPSSLLLTAIFFLLIDFKNHKKFLQWYIPSLLFLIVPYIIEPVNKIVHFSSYAFFPNRYGYMTTYFLIIGAAYYFINKKEKSDVKHSTWKASIITFLVCSVMVGISIYGYRHFQDGIFHLTISNDKNLFLMSMFLCIFEMISISLILFLKRSSKFYPYCFIMALVNILCYSSLYIGISSYQDVLQSPYQVMEELRRTHLPEDFYRLKTNTSSLITNNGMVSGYPNLDHFTSLVNKNNLRTLKQLGYSSHWTKTYSKNGTLFSDSLLANQYYLTTNQEVDDYYQPLDNIMDYHLYRFQEDLSFGYFTENLEFNEEEHTFAFQNRIYRAITSKEEDLFTVYDEFQTQNLRFTKKEGRTTYEIIDPEATNFLEIEISVSKKSVLYLEIFNSFDNTKDDSLYKQFNIYINNQLYKSNYPLSTNNGSLKLGTFENESVNIKIEFKSNIQLSYMEIGVLPLDSLVNFIKEEKVDNHIVFQKNKILINVNSEKEGLFFIPVAYSSGYQGKVNGEKETVQKVYGNFLGIQLEKGENTIEFTYISPGFKTGIKISFITLFILIILFTFGWYQKLIQTYWFSHFVESIYLFIYFFAFFLIYFIPIVCFFLSYFFYIY